MKASTLLASAGGMLLLAGAAVAQQAAPPVRPAPPAPPRATVPKAPAATPPAAPISGPVSAVPALLPATQAVIDGYVRDGKMPGIVGAFGVGDLPTMFVAAGRIADDPAAAAAGPDSLWRVYSMTKPITGMAAMILVEQGRIKLDDPVAKYIPAFRNMRVRLREDTLDSRPAKTAITIRMLLTHTAGLGYDIVTRGPLKQEYQRRGITPFATNADLEATARKARPASLAEFADRVAALPLIAEPGTTWSYSIGLDVMGRVIEVASGMSFDGFVQQRIFDPLRMTSSFWTVPQSEVGRLATNYIFAREGMKMLNPALDTSGVDPKMRIPLDPARTSAWLTPPSFPYGGAGLVMSARDYDRFLHMLQNEGALDGVRIMQPATARLAMSDLLPPGVTFSGTAVGGDATAPRMGFGAGGSVYLEDRPGGAGKGTYGWGGAAGTIAFVDPGRRARGTIMVNYFPGETYPLRREVLGALIADLQRFKR